MISLSNKIAAVVGVSMAAVIVYQFYTIKSNESTISTLSRNNAVLEQSVHDQNETVTDLERELTNAIKQSKDLSDKLLSIESKSKKQANRLNSYRNRLKNAAVKKTNLIERAANRAIDNFLLDLSKATGSQKETN